MAELAAVIAEYSLDNNAGGWFRPAWRNGWNAIELATAASNEKGGALGWLNETCKTRVPELAMSMTYELAGQFMNDAQTPMLRAALRCLQILVANSHGGGEVYNSILVDPFAMALPEDVFDLVLEYRCRDSIGTTAQFQGDLNDRLRRAFTTAWKRGLYVASYALPPAIRDNSSKLTVIKDAK
jgi:hypothetical protein